MAELRQVKATVSMPSAGDAAVSELTLTSTVGMVPTAQISYHIKEGQVQPVLGSTITDTAKSQQDTMFSDRRQPDTTLTAEDGQGNTLTFSGFLVAPGVRASTGHFARTANVVGAATLLTPLDLSIYKPAVFHKVSDKGLGTEDFAGDAEGSAGDLGGMMQEMIDATIKNFGPTEQETPEGLSRQILQTKHSVNETAVAVITEILGNSDLSFDNWSTFDNYERLKINLFTSLRQMLQQHQRDFWSVLQVIMQEFYLIYIPSWEDSGKFIKSSERSEGSEDEKVIEVTDVSIVAGGISVLPLTAVAVKGPVLPRVPDKDNQDARFMGRARIIAAHPEDFGTGRIEEVHLPNWIGSDRAVLNYLEAGEASSGVTLDLEAFQGEVEEQDTTSKDGGNEIGESILTEFAKNAYEDLKYANSTATVQVALNFSIEPGVRATVNIKNGGSFSGFIHSVKHGLNLTSGNSLDTYTTISFTHVKF